MENSSNWKSLSCLCTSTLSFLVIFKDLSTSSEMLVLKSKSEGKKKSNLEDLGKILILKLEQKISATKQKVQFYLFFPSSELHAFFLDLTVRLTFVLAQHHQSERSHQPNGTSNLPSNPFFRMSPFIHMKCKKSSGSSSDESFPSKLSPLKKSPNARCSSGICHFS